MRIIKVWDKKDYDPAWRRFIRSTARAVIIREGKLALVRSASEGFYLFPGGGIRRGESRINALIRETGEETGLTIIRSSIRELGMFREIRRSIYHNEIFDQRSYYYTANVKCRVEEQHLEPYEKKLGFELCFVDPQEAYEHEMALAKKLNRNLLFREAAVLREIIDSGLCLA